MTFQEYFSQIKARFIGADASAMADPTRIQINLTGEAAGTFYVEAKGGKLSIEPTSTTTGTWRSPSPPRTFRSCWTASWTRWPPSPSGSSRPRGIWAAPWS